MQTPVKEKAPLINTSHERLVISLKEKSLECKERRGKVEEMRASLKNNSVPVASELHSDLLSILSRQSFDSFPMMIIFWQQQQKAMACCKTRQMRWHPMMIRFCLSLAIKSPSAYDAFQMSFIYQVEGA